MFLSEADLQYIAQGPWHFGDVRYNLLSNNIAKDQKNITYVAQYPGQCRRYGGPGGRAPPLTTACAPLISAYSEYVFGISRNDKTTYDNGKRNNNVQALFSFKVFSILREIAGNQLLCIKVTQLTVLLTRLNGCVAEERCNPTESLPVPILRKWLWPERMRENICFKEQLFLFF